MWTRIVHQIARTKSVLYVCERVNNANSGCAMATTRDRASSSRYATSQPSTQQKEPGFPYQIAHPDGETDHHQYHAVLRHNGGPEQEAEILRSYLKPPENKSLSDLEGFHRSCSMGVLGSEKEETSSRFSASSDRLRSGISSHHQYRHSAPLRGASSPLGGSPRGKKTPFQLPFWAPSRDRSQDARNRQSPAPSILGSPSSTTALANFAMVRLPSHQVEDDEAPPMYSDVIQNPDFYGNVSRPKQSTSSGKM